MGKGHAEKNITKIFDRWTGHSLSDSNSLYDLFLYATFRVVNDKDDNHLGSKAEDIKVNQISSLGTVYPGTVLNECIGAAAHIAQHLTLPQLPETLPHLPDGRLSQPSFSKFLQLGFEIVWGCVIFDAVLV